MFKPQAFDGRNPVARAVAGLAGLLCDFGYSSRGASLIAAMVREYVPTSDCRVLFSCYGSVFPRVAWHAILPTLVGAVNTYLWFTNKVTTAATYSHQTPPHSLPAVTHTARRSKLGSQPTRP